MTTPTRGCQISDLAPTSCAWLRVARSVSHVERRDAKLPLSCAADPGRWHHRVAGIADGPQRRYPCAGCLDRVTAGRVLDKLSSRLVVACRRLVPRPWRRRPTSRRSSEPGAHLRRPRHRERRQPQGAVTTSNSGTALRFCRCSSARRRAGGHHRDAGGRAARVGVQTPTVVGPAGLFTLQVPAIALRASGPAVERGPRRGRAPSRVASRCRAPAA